tara:strand:- start:566 stop:748 length:183 start_codon:yes stop_codon:yes gene_type:complete
MKKAINNKWVNHICVGGIGYGGVIIGLAEGGKVLYTVGGRTTKSPSKRSDYGGYNRAKDC